MSEHFKQDDSLTSYHNIIIVIIYYATEAITQNKVNTFCNWAFAAAPL